MGSRDTLAVYGISHVREYVHGLHVHVCTADFAYSSLTVSSSIMRYAACVCMIVKQRLGSNLTHNHAVHHMP